MPVAAHENTQGNSVTPQQIHTRVLVILVPTASSQPTSAVIKSKLLNKNFAEVYCDAEETEIITLVPGLRAQRPQVLPRSSCSLHKAHAWQRLHVAADDSQAPSPPKPFFIHTLLPPANWCLQIPVSLISSQSPSRTPPPSLANDHSTAMSWCRVQSSPEERLRSLMNTLLWMDQPHAHCVLLTARNCSRREECTSRVFFLLVQLQILVDHVNI